MSYSLLNQTPVNGKIAWAGVNIVYDGVTYPVADGDTNSKYVFWTLASPLALQVAAEFPAIATEDCLVFLNNGGIATSILDASIVDGSLIVPGTIHATALVANSITADQMAANSVTADTIAANSITGEKVVANTITAEKIDSRGLTIKDNAGNVIFGVGTNLDVSFLDGFQEAIDAAVVASPPGADGQRGSRTFYVSGRTTWSDAVATTAASVSDGPVINDIVTQYGTTFSQTAFWNGSAWAIITAALDGNLLVTGSISGDKLVANTVTANKIDSRGLSIKDAEGNVILAAGTALDFLDFGSSVENPPSSINNSAIVVGGRNLIRKSTIGGTVTTDVNGGTNARVYAPGVGNNWRVSGWTRHEVGYYSLSFWVKVDTPMTVSSELCDLLGAGVAATTTWQLVKREGLFIDSVHLNDAYLGFIDIFGTDAGNIYISHLMLEAGTKCSDWSPAPEDVDAGIATAATTASWPGITGTGKPSDNATSDIVLVNAANITIAGNKITKTSGNNAIWDASAHSKNGYIGGAYVSAIADQTTTYVMFGLNTSNDLGGVSYTEIDYAVYLRGDGTIGVYEFNLDRGSFGTYAVGDVFAVTYDGSNVRYLKNGAVFRGPIAAVVTTQLFFDCSFYSLNGSLSGVAIGPMSSNAWGAIGARPADSALLNSFVSISPTGALTGGGGGQIQTIPTVDNDREGNPAPNAFAVGTTRQFKHSAAIGLADTNGYYCTLETIIQYASSQGGGSSYQYAYQEGKTWRRKSGDAGGTYWSSWVQDLDTAAYTGALNANYTTNTNQLTDGAGLGATANYGNLSGTPSAAIANNQDGIIQTPGGGLLITSSPIVGSIRIRLPQGYTNTMLRFTVDIYEYATGYSCSLAIGGYTYAAPQWHNVSAVVQGGNVEYPVYFGHDLNGYCSVWIGNLGTSWDYPQIRVSNVLVGYSNYARSQWEANWQVVIENSWWGSHNAQVLDTYPGANWAKVSGSDKPPGAAYTNAALADKLAKTGASILSGEVQMASQSAMWFGARHDNGSNGIYLGSSGIVGRKGGLNTFVIGADGSASFAGLLSGSDISGTTGTFSGMLAAGTVDMTKLIGELHNLTSPGSYSRVVPAGNSKMRVTVTGGGGAGGAGGELGGGGGGGGGATSVATFDVSPGATIYATVGGSGAASYVNGYLTGNPGAGGVAAGGGTAGAGGGAGGTGGTVNGTAGQAGGNGAYGYYYWVNTGGKEGYNAWMPAVYAAGGNGGASPYATAGRGGNGGSGGWGGGAAGNAGHVLIEFFNPNGVIIRNEWNTLTSALSRQGIAIV